MPKTNEIRESVNNSNVLSTSSHETANLVSVLNNTVVTTSLIVAEYFGKRHKDVLRAINTLECSVKFNQRNFAPVEYKDAKGELRPMYYLTRDGFTFLAIGFTGKVAAKFKENYINAFNEMEKAIYHGVNEEYILKKFKREFNKHNRDIRNSAMKYMQDIGMNGLPVCDLSTGYSVDIKSGLDFNLKNLINIFHCNTVAGWFALSDSIKKEMELKVIKEDMKDIVTILVRKHHILPE